MQTSDIHEGFTKDKARLTLDLAETSALDRKMAALIVLVGGGNDRNRAWPERHVFCAGVLPDSGYRRDAHAGSPAHPGRQHMYAAQPRKPHEVTAKEAGHAVP